MYSQLFLDQVHPQSYPNKLECICFYPKINCIKGKIFGIYFCKGGENQNLDNLGI